jgi:transcriptional regulator with XRE-family HTH domain
MSDSIEKSFGIRVRELRNRAGLSQEELAFRAGIHRNYLGGIERGERNPGLKNIRAIADALNISLKELFDFVYSDCSVRQSN